MPRPTPVLVMHKRSTNGVATSVGTELGFYEGAAAARGNQEKD